MVLSPSPAPLLTSIPVLLSLLVAFQSTSGFSPSIRQLLPIKYVSSWSRCCLTLKARKTRRRRKIPTGDEATGGSMDELPDFDLDEEGNNKATVKDSAPVKNRVSKASSSSSADPFGEISANMMGSSGGPTKSFQELLNDRSLERKLQFDDVSEEGESLPDLAAMTRQQRELERQTGLPSPVRTKRARQEARRSAAIAAKENQEEEEGLLAKLPLIRDESGKISPLKILENGTWVCIAMLILWEFYINSPFFERAAPMAPVVYEIFL